jgi:hypothetical protein
MDWTTLKDTIYGFDGSWLDIYVLDTTQKDWKKWVDIVNEQYSVSFYNGQTEKTETKIDFQAVLNKWSGKTDLINGATIKLDGVDINCHFFSDQEIENDIDPRQVKTIDDHNKLMDYLGTVSAALNKRVILTQENLQEFVLIECENGKITVPNRRANKSGDENRKLKF